MNSLVSSLAFVAGLSLSSAATAEDRSNAIIPDGEQSYSLPFSFSGAEKPFTANDVSRQLSQNSFAYYSEIDDVIDYIKPHHFGVDTLPETDEATLLVWRAFNEEYYARLFPEGSQQYDLAKQFLSGDIPYAGFETIVSAIKDSEHINGFNRPVDQYLSMIESLKGVRLTPDQGETLKQIISENYDALVDFSVRAELAVGFLGTDARPVVNEYIDRWVRFEDELWDELERRDPSFHMPENVYEI
ncbi:MAG: hypothetical protein AB8B83_05250 [Bdellovibrionales bacterium]